MTRYRARLAAIALTLLLLSLPAGGCRAPDDGFDRHLRGIVRPHAFSIIRWEYTTLQQELAQRSDDPRPGSDQAISGVLDYFAATAQMRVITARMPALRDSPTKLAALQTELDQLRQVKLELQESVERAIEGQARAVLADEGIFNPWQSLLRPSVRFPPINFKLETPPNVLVISPRDRIESIREITLEPELDPDEIAEIERETDQLGVSSLVVELGGLGATFPTLVTNDASLRFTLNVVAEEWLHQYLTFKPLGFLYVLDLTGLARDYEIATINESLASMIGKEIGGIVYERYYHHQTGDLAEPVDKETEFDREMRAIRIAVDDYLARGEVERAEQFMEERRQYLGTRGYYVRKLNQAYFAFHGAYADDPASVSPIGQELRQLRAESDTLAEFLDTAAAVTSRTHLREIIDSQGSLSGRGSR